MATFLTSLSALFFFVRLALGFGEGVAAFATVFFFGVSFAVAFGERDGVAVAVGLGFATGAAEGVALRVGVTIAVGRGVGLGSSISLFADVRAGCSSGDSSVVCASEERGGDGVGAISEATVGADAPVVLTSPAFPSIQRISVVLAFFALPLQRARPSRRAT